MEVLIFMEVEAEVSRLLRGGAGNSGVTITVRPGLDT